MRRLANGRKGLGTRDLGRLCPQSFVTRAEAQKQGSDAAE